MSLIAVPISLVEANEFIRRTHRHHSPVIGHKFSIGAVAQNELVGVSVCGRPVARKCDHLTVLEVTRVATNGYRNACSFLYGKCANAAKAMGYEKIQTYTLESEMGSSLRAAGFLPAAVSPGGSWNGGNRTGRNDSQPLCPKIRWERKLNHATSEWVHGKRIVPNKHQDQLDLF